MKKIVITPDNGIKEVDMTAEEVSTRETETANETAYEEKLKADKEAKDTLKASAKAKLMAGEPLTEDEADQIIL